MLCFPAIVTYLSEYSQDEEMVQNLLDTLVVLVNKGFFKGHDEIIAKNVSEIFSSKEAVHVLFEQLGGSDMYSKLCVMELLRDCLDINRVDANSKSDAVDARGRLRESEPDCAAEAGGLSERQS